MILDASGRRVVSRAVLEMTEPQVRWFLNGKAFLRHLHQLGQVKLAAYCQYCYAHGLPDAVSAGPEGDQFVVRCGHRSCQLNWAKIRDTDELLAKLGWSLRCAGDCERKGMADGVEGLNDPRWGTVEVTCGCTERKYALPVTRH